MKIMIVDDEIRAVNLLTMILQQEVPGVQSRKDVIIPFTSPRLALEYLEQNPVDIAFLDIEMPEITGLSLAEKLKTMGEHAPEIIFVTAFPQYALDAWTLPAAGYILKPFDAEQIIPVLERAVLLCSSRKPKQLHMRCFPQFEVLLDHIPLAFQSKKAKELLALLVYYRGNWVDLDKITFNLFEYMEEHSAKNYCRTILHRLRQTLSEAGFPDIVENKYGKIRVNTDLFTCDYYDYLAGDTSLFVGEFLSEYSWAEPALSAMLQKLK